MVFETLVADLLNRFLGDFVDNLDASQLNIGIWGGDVKLNNLEIKETALDDLDLPIKLKFGFLSNLVLKIPWKNLYTEPVLANIEGLYLIVVPNKGVVYNEEKAKKNEFETKQKSLARLEENRKNRRKPKDPAADTFAEKMVAQVIKNLQVKIKNIHIRFEDKYTNRHRPFCAGVTLDFLDFQTTDENWKAMIVKETVQVFHKLVSLQNLAVYWNPSSKLFSDLKSNEEIKKALMETIANENHKPSDFKYVLEPITIEAKLALNQKPDTTEWEIPKIDLNVDVDKLALSIGKFQYQDVLLFLEAQERFVLAGRYLRFRPNLIEYRGNYKTWWHFAYNCILEENIRRKRRNWSWKRMKAHRQLVHQYQDAWVKKQTEKNPGSAVLATIEKAEKELDVFNLNVARHQAEMNIDRFELTRLEDQQNGWGAWAKSWFGGGGQQPKKQEKQSDDILGKFQEEMTPEEKQKLFDAIDYQENMPATDYPKTFVENKIEIKLKTVAVIVQEAVELEFKDLSANVEQRPSANALFLKAAIRSVTMDGCGHSILSPVLKPQENWLDLKVETNPLTGNFDQIVSFATRQVMVKYHAPAINAAIDVFKPPESVLLNQLTATALQKYEDVKARSVTGLQYAVDKRAKLKLEIRIEPATIIITEGGIFDENKPNLITELGLLTIETTDLSNPDTYQDITDERHRKIVMAAYDKFQIKLSDMHVIFAEDYSKAITARTDKESIYHVLKPTGLNVGLHKCAIDDLNMPKLKLFGDLPDIVVDISDTRLIGLMKLGLSIPLPVSEEQPIVDIAAPINAISARDRAKMKTIMEVDEISEADDENEHEEKENEDHKKIKEQQVQIDVNLNLNRIGFCISHENHPIVIVSLKRFGLHFQMRNFDMVVMMHLGSITIEQPNFKDLKDFSKTLFLIDNPQEEGDHLITMKFVQANEESPFFATEYKNTRQTIDFEFKELNLNLHQGALVTIKNFGEKLQKEIAEIKKQDPEKIKEMAEGWDRMNRKISRQISGSIASFRSSGSQEGKELIRKKRQLKGKKPSGVEVDPSRIIDMHLNAHVHALSVIIGTNEGADTNLQIRQITSTVTMQANQMTVTAGLKEIIMKDETPNALHKFLLSVGGKEEMFHMDFIQYNRTNEEKKRMSLADVDMEVKIKFAQLRFVFLNVWVNRMLNWISPFQAEAAQAAAQAQAIATEKATEAAQTVKQVMIESPPRLRLDIELAAPAIIVPRISTSNEVILVDLGHLKLKNQFNKADEALIDELTIQLKDVHVSTGILDKGHNEKVISSCQILKPLSFALSVFRNLNFQNVKELPELTIKAYLPLMDVSMSQMDYTLLMHTLAGNLTEGTPPPPAKPLPPPSRIGDAATNGEEPKKKIPDSDKKLSPETKSPQHVKRLVFKFSMDDIHAALYSGSSGLQSGKGHLDRDGKNAFASMKIHELLVTGFMFEDGGMDVAITLHSFSMTDERQTKTKVRQLMDKKDGHADNKFVNLKFNQNSKGDKDIIINSSAFYLFLCPEFLGQLSSFFVVPKSPEESTIPPDVAARNKIAKQQAAINAGTAGVATTTTTLIKSKIPVSPEPQTQSMAGSLALKGSINDIEIILIENSLEPKSSQALILSFNALLDGNTESGKQKISGEIKDLQIVSTYFAPELRHLANYNVLNKMNIVLAIEIDMATQGQIVSATMNSVHIKVSPAIIRLLSAVGTQFSENRIQIDEEEKSFLPNFPNYWIKRKYNRQEFWWFNDVAEEAIEDEEMDIEQPQLSSKIEAASFSINRFVITLEAGTDENTIPMILLESSLNATATNWSSCLSCDAKTQLQISYYNEGFSVWEPIIEPVLKDHDGEAVWEPWNVTMAVRSTKDDVDVEEGMILSPKMQISIDAIDTLNITVTKSLLMLLTKLSISFEKAAKNQLPTRTRQFPGTSPYLILNDTGIAVKIGNSDSMKVTDKGLIDATHGDYVELNIIGWEQKIGLMQVEDNRKAELSLEMMQTEREVNVMRAETRSVRLPRHAASGRQWTMVVDTNIENNRRIVTLKSLVNFVNHTNMKIEIHSLRDTNLDLCGNAEIDGEPLNIAIPLLYTPTGEFYIRPANDQYETSNESISWHQFEETNRAIVRCDLSTDIKEGIYFDLVAVEEPVLGEIGSTEVEKQWTVHIYPPMVLRNLLPFPIEIVDPIQKSIDGGEEIAVNAIPGKKIALKMEYEESFTAIFDISHNRGELEVITFVADNDQTRILYLGIHWSTKHLRRDCQIYCPYWLVNNTGKELQYLETIQANIIHQSACACKRRRRDSQPEYCLRHEPTRNPILLPFADKNFLSKKKARVKIENSQFSDEFPLDTAGSAARVICKDSTRTYELTVDIQVCQSGLTKVVSFSPFYLLYNESKFALEVAEPDDCEWISVQPETCTGLWPKQKSTRKLIRARYADTTESSIPFPFTENFEAFCTIDSNHLGIYATCSVGESSAVAHVEPFELGMAPAQVMNATEFPITFGQKGHSKKTQLMPWETADFKWEDVTIQDRKFEWHCGEHGGEDELVRNAYSSFLPSKDKGYHYWVSFLHGRQRFFLVTDDLAVMTTAQQAYEIERMDLQTEINIRGIGISIVNNLVSQEIIYMGLSCSGILWEQKIKNRFKAFAVKDIETLEECYQKWINDGKPEGRHQIILAGTSVGIDFGLMILFRKGKKSELKIRRNYANGLWMLYRQSMHQKQIHLKVNHLQIDNELPACIFPCVLAVVPPPKSIIADNVPKPFTELSITMQKSEHSNIVQYKYLHMLIQEFAIRLDQGLINSLIAMFSNESTSGPYNKEIFQKDIELAKPHLSEKAMSTAATQQKAFYDDLHISPLMIHLSFSQGGVVAGIGHISDQKGKEKDEQGGINIQSEFINVLLKSVGVSLTEIQDVVFRLAFFERKNAFYSMPQLQTEIQSHYTMQFVKQLYVLVLGLDIIGNPFGLVRDLSAGVEDLFYQPFQGAIQGPEEFAEGLALGVTSLFGNAVGGAAGAVSRITGTLGKGIAALTLDEDYQRKRQEALNRKPANFGEGLSRGAKGLGQGFYDGVTGIVTKPVEGMKSGGFGGLVKGVGKGLVGAVTRPVSGVVDFASSSLEAVKTVAGKNENTTALRPPRVIPRDQIVRPYDYTEAIGYKFFRDTDRGKYADTDHYITHGLISERCVFIVTDKRVFLSKRQDLLGTWVDEWVIEYPEIATIKKTENGISFELKHKKKGLLGFGGSRGKIVEFKNKVIADKIYSRVETAFETE